MSADHTIYIPAGQHFAVSPVLNAEWLTHVATGVVLVIPPGRETVIPLGGDWRLGSHLDLLAEHRRTRDVLAPDNDTTGTPLDEVAREALHVASTPSAPPERPRCNADDGAARRRPLPRGDLVSALEDVRNDINDVADDLAAGRVAARELIERLRRIEAVVARAEAAAAATSRSSSPSVQEAP